MKSGINRRRLGKTGLYVTELSFGAMNLRLMNFIESHMNYWTMYWIRALT